MDTSSQAKGITQGTAVCSQECMDRLHSIKMALLDSGKPIIDLSMINPDIPPAPILIDRLLEAAAKPEHSRYAVARGIRRLREAFADKYRTAFDVSIAAESEVCVTAGTKDAILSVLRPFAGKRILLPSPTYPMHRVVAELAGMSIALYPITGSWDQTLSAIAQELERGDVAVVLINFPNNPTGTIRTLSELQALVELVTRFDAWLLNDFVYGELVHAHNTGPTAGVSLLKAAGPHRNRVLETYSLSKAYSVPGWRVAAVVGPAVSIDQIARFKSQADYGIFLPIQIAAAAALTASPSAAQPVRLLYAERARRFREALKGVGFAVEPVQAGASIWCKIPARLPIADTIAERLLSEYQVSVVPGSYFGIDYNRWLRIALVSNEQNWGRIFEAFRQVSKP